MQSYSKIVAFKLTTENGLPGAVEGRPRATKGGNGVIKEVNTVCQFVSLFYLFYLFSLS